MPITVLDLATPQRGINFSAASAAGVRAAYVKLGGDNIARYVAPSYVNEVDGARAQGWTVGHYWVSGPTDPAGAADFYVSNLHGLDITRDFFVLDDETLDQGRIYEPADAARFLARVQEHTGCRSSQLFLYVGAGDLRARDWAPVEQLGARLIVSSYGSNTGTRDHEPNLGGRFGGVWAGHQYTSNGRFGGVPTDVNLFQDWAFDYTAPPAPKGLFMSLSPAEEQEILLGMRDLHTGTGLGNARGWTQAQVEQFSIYARLAALQEGTPITLSDADKADIASRVAAQLTGLQFVPKAG